MIFTIIFLITSVFQTYICYLWMHCFLKGTRTEKKVVYFAYVILFIMMTVPYLVINIPIVTLMFSYAANLLITVVYHGSLKLKILVGTFLMVMMAITESIVAVFSGYVGLHVFQSNEYYSIWGTVCLPVFQLLVVLIVRNFKNMKEGEEIAGSYWAISILLPLLTIYLFFLFYKQTYIAHTDMISCTIVLLVVNIFVFSLYDKQVQNYKIKQEKESLQLQNTYQLNQLELMHEAVEKSRSLKHDFLKHISMIDYCLSHQTNEQLSDYIKEIHNNVEWTQKYIDTGNFVFDSILNYKIQEAAEKEVNINAEVKLPETLEVSTYDMNIILTNLIDNSIEAVEKTENKNIIIRIIYSRDRLKIEIQNAYKGKIQRYRNEFGTTKKDVENHGYGLKNVREIVNKYDGLIKIRTENDIFNISVCLFLS